MIGATNTLVQSVVRDPRIPLPSTCPCMLGPVKRSFSIRKHLVTHIMSAPKQSTGKQYGVGKQTTGKQTTSKQTTKKQASGKQTARKQRNKRPRRNSFNTDVDNSDDEEYKPYVARA